MAGSTSPAEPARQRRRRAWTRLGAAVLVTIGIVASCELFQGDEPRASNDVLNAIVNGMRRVSSHPG
jgi:hypothetical protein